LKLKMRRSLRGGYRKGVHVIWSYTSIDLFQTCGKWVYHKHVAKDLPPEVKTEEQQWGIDVHLALERRCRDGVPLPEHFKRWEPLAASVCNAGTPLVEFKVGLGRDFKPRGFFADDVWGRGVFDIALVPDVSLDRPRKHKKTAAIFDWKTGKPKEKPLQLKLFALFGFAHWPVDEIVTANIWLKTGKPGTPTLFRREQVPALWAEVLPTINAMERSEATGDWRAQPGPLCGWCPVTSCVHNPRS